MAKRPLRTGEARPSALRPDPQTDRGRPVARQQPYTGSRRRSSEVGAALLGCVLVLALLLGGSSANPKEALFAAVSQISDPDASQETSASAPVRERETACQKGDSAGDLLPC